MQAMLLPGRRARLCAIRILAIVMGNCSLAPIATPQDATLLATVLDERTGEAVGGLPAGRFSVLDGDIQLQVVSVSEPRKPFDLLMLVDTSIVGEAVRPVAAALIEELAEDEVMGIVAFDEGAELLQDFTSEKQYLRQALDRCRYGNLPKVHDGLFAAIDGGFEASGNRKAVVLLSAGAVARGRISEAEVVDAARAKRATVYSVFTRNDDRTILRRLALRTAGASFSARRLKLKPRELASRIMDAVRSPYEVEVTGVLTFGDRVSATVSSPPGSKQRLTAGVMPVE